MNFINGLERQAMLFIGWSSINSHL